MACMFFQTHCCIDSQRKTDRQTETHLLSHTSNTSASSPRQSRQARTYSQAWLIKVPRTSSLSSLCLSGLSSLCLFFVFVCVSFALSQFVQCRGVVWELCYRSTGAGAIIAVSEILQNGSRAGVRASKDIKGGNPRAVVASATGGAEESNSTRCIHSSTSEFSDVVPVKYIFRASSTKLHY